MIKYYTRLNMKYARKKVFDTMTQAIEYYRYLQDKYNTNQVIIGIVK